MDLKRYRCHKVVRAAKIVRVVVDAAWCLLTLDGASTTYPVTLAWAKKHDPQPGGYLVRYEDGYESFSPAAAFEAGYTLIEE